MEGSVTVRSLALTTSLLTFLAAPAAAQAQSPTQTEIEALRSDIQRMTQRLDELEKRAAQPVQEAAPANEVTASTPPADRLGPSPGAPPTPTVAPLDRAFLGAGSQVEINATSGSSAVSLKLGRETTNLEIPDRQDVGWSTTNRWILTASAPLNKKATSTDLATIDGFASDFELRLQRSWFRRWVRDPPLDDVALLELEQAAVRACQGRPGATEKEKAACVEDLPKQGSKFIRDHLGPEKETTYLQAFFPRHSAWGYGFEGRVGYKNHNYIDSTLFTTAQQDRTPWGLRMFGSWLPTGRVWGFTGTVDYQQTYEDKKAQVLCPALSTAPVTCLNGPVGRPDSKEKLLTSAEWRTLVFPGEFALFKTIGISAQFTYDHKSDEYGFDLPIYVVPDDKSNLIGGVRLGYKSEDDDFAVGIFVGAPFGGP